MTTSVAKWSNVQVAIQSALAGAVTISAISKTNPALVTCSGAHGLSNGDYVLLTVNGMFQVDSRVFRVQAGSPIETVTFYLEDEDATLYDTFTSGTVEKITFGTSMTTATGLQASGGDFNFIEVTTIHDNVAKQVPGLASAATYTFENLWNPADTALIALKAASDNQALRCMRFTFAGGQKVLFVGYVGCTLLPTGTAQDKVVTSVAVTMFGRPTIYAD